MGDLTLGGGWFAGRRGGLGSAAAAVAASFVLVGCGAHQSSHTVTGSRGGLTYGVLDVDSGAASITVESASLGGILYRVSTPSRSALRPVVKLANGRLQVALTGHGGGPSSLRIVLSDSVIWQLRLNGGASELAVDFGGGKLGALDLVAGDSRATLNLPHPSGSVKIVEHGGLRRLAVKVADRSPVRLTFSGGASSADIYGTSHTGIAGGSVFASPGWSAAGDRYDLLASGGISSVSVVGS